MGRVRNVRLAPDVLAEMVCDSSTLQQLDLLRAYGPGPVDPAEPLLEHTAWPSRLDDTGGRTLAKAIIENPRLPLQRLRLQHQHQRG